MSESMDSNATPVAIGTSRCAERRHQTLDLHEKAHGSHGTCRGYDGFEKSGYCSRTYRFWHAISILTTLIPALIDYKGGGANLKLPHLLEHMNLTGREHESARIYQEELKRRQDVFNRNVQHQQVFGEIQSWSGDRAYATPLIISDEFAELNLSSAACVDMSRPSLGGISYLRRNLRECG